MSVSAAAEYDNAAAEYDSAAAEYDSAVRRLFAAFEGTCLGLMDAKVDHCIALVETIEPYLMDLVDVDGHGRAAVILTTLKDHMRAVKSAGGRLQ